MFIRERMIYMKFDAWNGFSAGDWQNQINVRDFIQKNYTPYEGDSSFLTRTYR